MSDPSDDRTRGRDEPDLDDGVDWDEERLKARTAAALYVIAAVGITGAVAIDGCAAFYALTRWPRTDADGRWRWPTQPRSRLRRYRERRCAGKSGRRRRRRLGRFLVTSRLTSHAEV
jgi:hypothetical protein